MKIRWLPRIHFSLRTLLLLVLTASSGATLWWNWGPWGVAYTVKEPGAIQTANFSDDDRFLVLGYVEESKPGRILYADIRDAATGNRYRLLKGPPNEDYLTLAGNYIKFEREQGYDIYNFLSGERVNYEKFAPFRRLSSPQICDDYILMYCDDADILANLPGLEVVKKIPPSKGTQWNDRFDSRLANGKLFYIKDKHVDIYDLKSQQTISTPEIHCDHMSIKDFKWWPRGQREMLLVRSYSPSDPGYDVEEFVFNPINGELIGRLPINSTLSRGGRTALTDVWEDSDFTLKLFDLTTQTSKNFPGGKQKHEQMRFSPDGTLVLSHDGIAYDAKTLMQLWNHKLTLTSFSNTGEFLFAHITVEPAYSSIPNNATIMNARSGNTLLDFSDIRWRDEDVLSSEILWTHTSPTFCLRGNSYSDLALQSRIRVFKARRPIPWSGPAYLPEFWLTILLSAALIYSLLRDRKNA